MEQGGGAHAPLAVGCTLQRAASPAPPLCPPPTSTCPLSASISFTRSLSFAVASSSSAPCARCLASNDDFSVSCSQRRGVNLV